MPDFNKPQLSDDYSSVLQAVRDLLAECAKMQDGSSNTNVPTGAVRFSTANSRFEKWNGSSWVELIPKASNKYDINVDRVDGYDAGNASGNYLAINNGTLNANLNADMVDGKHADAFAAAAPQGIGGVTRLFRRDDTSYYSVQTYWTNTRWRLEGYVNDNPHAQCEVAYADVAGNALALNGVGPSSIMQYRGGVYLSAMDTLVQNGFYSVLYSGSTSALLVFDSGNSVGPFQLECFYQGSMRFRNKTDSNTWTPWKTVYTDANLNPATLSVNYAASAGSSNTAQTAVNAQQTASSDPTYSNNTTNTVSSNWVRGAMGAIATAAGFVIIESDKYWAVKLPSWLGGFIIQGGLTAFSDYFNLQNTAVTFTTTFPNKCYGVQASLSRGSSATIGGDDMSALISTSSITTAGFNAKPNEGAGVTQNAGISFVAFGR